MVRFLGQSTQNADGSRSVSFEDGDITGRLTRGKSGGAYYFTVVVDGDQESYSTAGVYTQDQWELGLTDALAGRDLERSANADAEERAAAKVAAMEVEATGAKRKQYGVLRFRPTSTGRERNPSTSSEWFDDPADALAKWEAGGENDVNRALVADLFMRLVTPQGQISRPVRMTVDSLRTKVGKAETPVLPADLIRNRIESRLAGLDLQREASQSVLDKILSDITVMVGSETVPNAELRRKLKNALIMAEEREKVLANLKAERNAFEWLLGSDGEDER